MYKKMKKNDMITVVVMGDEGVGKTSLISTFVSRHFSDVGLPGCMTRITLPPDTTTYMPYFVESSSSNSTSNKGFVTTLVDTEGADDSLQSALFMATNSNNNNNNTRLPIASAAARTTNNDEEDASNSPSSSLSSPTNSNDQQQHEQEKQVAEVIVEVVPKSSSTSSSSTSEEDITNTSTTAPPPPTTTTPSSSGTRVVMSMDVNVIVLVYDLDKLNTFDRLEQHWLPLIQACFGEEVPVIIAGNKFDLWLDNNSATTTTHIPQQLSTTTTTTLQHHPTDRQRIVSLLQRFKFVRQCIKCSAKTLFHVTDIFQKAQHAVLFPIQPLYDLQHDCLTQDAQRAFCRIFRMIDTDHDGSLNNSELEEFQKRCFRVWGPLLDETLSGWNKILSKKVVSNNNTSTSTTSIYLYPYGNNTTTDNTQEATAVALLREGKFTMAGFFSIFEVFMSKDRMEIPWQILRIYGYDDNLQLHIPSSVTTTTTTTASPLLSPCAITFLISLFQQFDIDNDGILTEADILAIFAIISPDNNTLPPWHPSRSQQVYKKAFSLPKVCCCWYSNSNNNNTIEFNTNNGLSLPDDSFTADGITIASSSHNNGDSNTNILLLTPSSTLVRETRSSSIAVEQPSSMAAIISSQHQQQQQQQQQHTRILHHPPFSLLDWMSHWYMSACISPTSTRAELYQLGHVESSTTTASSDGNKKSKRSTTKQQQQQATTPAIPAITSAKNYVVRIRVFGKDGCGKTTLLNTLCQTDYADRHHNHTTSSYSSSEEATTTVTTAIPVTSCAHMLFTSSSTAAAFRSTAQFTTDDNVIVHFVFTDIPERTVAEVERPDILIHNKDCDLVVLVFNCLDRSSFSYLLDLESRLFSSDDTDDETPRMFIGIRIEGNTNDNNNTDDASSERSFMDRQEEADVLTMARLHCSSLDIEPPLIITTTTATAVHAAAAAAADSNVVKLTSMTVSLSPDKSFVLKRLIQYTRGGLLLVLREARLKSIPLECQKKATNEVTKKRRLIWIGCGFFVSAVVVWTTFWPPKQGNNSKGWWWWRRCWFFQKLK